MTSEHDADDGETTPGPATAEQLADRVADLQALTARLAAQLAEQETRWTELSEITAQLESGQHTRPGPEQTGRLAPGDGQIPLFSPSVPQPVLGGAAVLPQSSDAADPDQDADDPDQGAEEPALAPQFIVLFDPGSDEEHAEMLALDDWVRHVLVPTYVKQVSSRRPWCDHWWDHDEARARLHALWLAWQELTDQTVGGHTGPSSWHRDHLGDAMDELRSHDGVFSACMIDPQAPSHRRNPQTPVKPYQDSSEQPGPGGSVGHPGP